MVLILLSILSGLLRFLLDNVSIAASITPLRYIHAFVLVPLPVFFNLTRSLRTGFSGSLVSLPEIVPVYATPAVLMLLGILLCSMPLRVR